MALPPILRNNATGYERSVFSPVRSGPQGCRPWVSVCSVKGIQIDPPSGRLSYRSQYQRSPTSSQKPSSMAESRRRIAGNIEMIRARLIEGIVGSNDLGFCPCQRLFKRCGLGWFSKTFSDSKISSSLNSRSCSSWAKYLSYAPRSRSP